MPPPRCPPADSEPVTLLCDGLTVTAERLRHTALASAMSPAATSSWRRRARLGDLGEAGVAAGASLSIDLAWPGFRSPHRAKAYESANSPARAHHARPIPPRTPLL